jgi:hypothetical protein
MPMCKESDNSLHVQQYAVSPELFSSGFPVAEGPCHCSSTCCNGGVYTDLAERDAILAQKEMIRKYMDETQNPDDALWFEEVVEEDTDFVSGRCVGTRVINGKCGFLRRDGFCSLQVAATAEGMTRWALKPLYCILYPIEVTDNVVSFDGRLQDKTACCSVVGEFQVPLFQACRDELIHLLGEEGYATMEQHYAALQSTTMRKMTL